MAKVRPVRVLLTTLHDVLPPHLRLSSQPLSASAVAHFDKRWQRVGLAEVLAASDVKRYVNKARLAVALTSSPATSTRTPPWPARPSTTTSTRPSTTFATTKWEVVGWFEGGGWCFVGGFRFMGLVHGGFSGGIRTREVERRPWRGVGRLKTTQVYTI